PPPALRGRPGRPQRPAHRRGARAAERALGGIDLYGGDQLDALTRLNVALHAHALLRRDVDYIVRDGRIQSLGRRYPPACGMTATAVAVGGELREFYGLEVAVIPPNRPCVREDEPDGLYATVAEKEQAIAGEVVAAHATGRPVLIGTLDIVESERLARRLSAA